MTDGQKKEIDHHWNQALRRYEYFETHSIEWLRNTANQIALVNSLGATVSVGLAAVIQSSIFLLPAAAFLLGAILTLAAAYCAYQGNARYSEEMSSRINELAKMVKSDAEEAMTYARGELKSGVFSGQKSHKIGEKLAWAAIICIGIGVAFLIPVIICTTQ